MNSFRILHLTDWHLNDPNSENENLRSLHYRDYVNGLYNELKKNDQEAIDLLICSGDFIDKGKVENFSLAKEIIDFLSKKISISPNSIITTIGNHDVVVTDYKKANQNEYLNFSKYYKAANYIKDESVYKIFKIKDDVYCLSLNSIFNQENEINNDISNTRIIKPSLLNNLTIDRIVTDVELNIPSDSLLIVVSHFPMILNNRMEMIVEEEKWVEKHLWISGRDIVRRIINNRMDNSILCLYGDGHSDNYWSFSERHHFFMTGMFGGDYINNTYTDAGKTHAYNKTNDAKIIEYRSFDQEPVVTTYSYGPEAFKFKAQSGIWRALGGKIIVERTKEHVYNSINKNEIKSIGASNIDLISEPIEQKIIEEVKLNDLYIFTRTVTSDEQSSLGWISISSLFQNRELFAGSIDKTHDWLTQHTETHLSSECIYIGLGFWGAIFGAQINVRKPNAFHCLSSKRIKGNQIYFESIEYIIEHVKDRTIKEVIIFTDVISTGTSILSLKDQLMENTNMQKSKFYAVSIISDKNQHQQAQLNQFVKVGTLCESIPIPVLPNDRLPDESIFPISFDFR